MLFLINIRTKGKYIYCNFIPKTVIFALRKEVHLNIYTRSIPQKNNIPHRFFVMFFHHSYHKRTIKGLKYLNCKTTIYPHDNINSGLARAEKNIDTHRTILKQYSHSRYLYFSRLFTSPRWKIMTAKASSTRKASGYCMT